MIDALPLPRLDQERLEADRLAHLRATMSEFGLAAVLLTNPISIRYATGYRNYALFQSHIPSAYLLVAAEGPVVLAGGYSGGHPTITEARPAHSTAIFDAGLDPRWAVERMAGDMKRFLGEAGLESTTEVGVERFPPSVIDGLREEGLRLSDAEPVVELARSRKLPDEMVALRHAIAVAEFGMAAMAESLRPGVTENQLWSILHQVNIANDGDWMDGRILCSGPRTNPWYQEASGRRIERGDLVAFDTDMIGPYGYCADISRTWVCGAPPTAEQRDLLARAAEEIEHNMALLRVGAGFRDLSQAVFAHPDDIVANRYACAFHGVGMSDEYPKIPYPQDWDLTGYDGEIEEGTVLSVESYVGRVGGNQGVKLEQMVQVTSAGPEVLSRGELVPDLRNS